MGSDTDLDLDAGWEAPLVPGQPAEVVVETARETPGGPTKPPAVPSAALR